MKEIEDKWVPTLNTKYIIDHIIGLMQNPSADTPVNEAVAGVYKSNPKQWATTAADWTKSYAK